MGRPVVHWEINAREPARLQQFFRELFDWRIDSNNPMNYGVVDTGGGGINGGIGGGDGRPGVTFYVEVNDLQAYLDRVGQLGGKTVQGPVEIPDMVTFALFEDPEGNTIGLVKSA